MLSHINNIFQCLIPHLFDICDNEDDKSINMYKKMNSSYLDYPLPSMYNHRMLCVSLDIWPYQMDILLKFKDSKLYRFIYDINFECIDVESFIRSLLITNFDDFNPNIFQIEEFKCIYHGYSSTLKNYSIMYNNETKSLINPSNNFSVGLCCKFLILILNEVNVRFLNKTNYSKLVLLHLRMIKMTEVSLKGFLFPDGWVMKT